MTASNVSSRPPSVALIVDAEGRIIDRGGVIPEAWGEGPPPSLGDVVFDEAGEPLRLTDLLAPGTRRARLGARSGPCLELETVPLSTEPGRTLLICHPSPRQPLEEDELRAIKERYDFASEVGKVGAWDWDPTTGELVWTDQTYRLFGLVPGSVVPDYGLFIKLVHPDDRERLQEAVRAALEEHSPYNIDHRAVLGDGTVKVFNATGRVTFDESGRPVRMLGTYHDVTARDLAAREMALAREQAESANRLKSSFLANMSHELRTPLNAILGYTNLVGRAAGLDDTQRERLAIVRQSGQHLLDLINGVLEMSKIESGWAELHPHDVDTRAFLRSIEDAFSLRASDKGLALSIDALRSVPRAVHVDETKLRQSLINLLDNAFKYTDQGSISLTAETIQGRAGALRFIVQDTGVGISADNRASIFEPFVQAGDTNGRTKGTGLGLPITRGFARLMGGDLTLADPLGAGSGSTFVLDIEARRAEPNDIEPTSVGQRLIGLEAGAARLRLLVVDDDATGRSLMTDLLGELGDDIFDIDSVGSGEAAVQRTLEWRPDLVWMDIRMAGIDGYEATRQIRREWASTARRPVIVALTASSFSQEEDKARSAGCDAFLRKPFREEDLLGLLTRHLALRVEADPGGAPRSATPPTRRRASAETLAALGSGWQGAMRAAVGELDAERMGALIEAARGHDADLGGALAALAEDFEYDAMLALLG
jgi:PAS domain S-box-containing protein